MIILNEKTIMENYLIDQAIKDIQATLEHLVDGKINSPMRTVIEFPESDASVLYMPSTDTVDALMAMKVVTIFPNNPAKNMPTTQGIVLVSDAKDGRHLATMNASYLTRLRTGAISGLATDKLAKKETKTLTMVGTGGMAFEQALGVLAVRDIEEIYLFNPTRSKAEVFKEKLYDYGVNQKMPIHIVDNVSDAVKVADVICCSTRSTTPVFDASDLKAGTHVNGVGSYLPHMREVSYEFIQKASKIVVDDFDGVKHEAGELIHANQQTGWDFEKIHGELKQLATGQIAARENDQEITFFKSVGAAYYDLAVAIGMYKVAAEKEIGQVVEI